MKFIILLLAISAFVSAEFTADQKQAWQSWKLKHAKLFLSGDKEKERMKKFLKNKEDVDQHNEAFLNGETMYTKQLHENSDLTNEEFIARFTGAVEEPETRDSNIEPVKIRASYPDQLDLTLTGGINPIKYQGGCGSCWAYSTNAALEYAVWKKTGKLHVLSEQQLVDCVYAPKGGCQGGWMPTAFNYIATAGGITNSTIYPQIAKNDTCKTNVPYVAKIAAKPNNYVHVASDDASIKSALATYGVLSVCSDVSVWSSYKAGIYSDTKFNVTKPSCAHAIGIVGYGMINGTIPYWKIRNSWGVSWGEKGYMRLDARRYPNGNVYSGLIPTTVYYANAA